MDGNILIIDDSDIRINEVDPSVEKRIGEILVEREYLSYDDIETIHLAGGETELDKAIIESLKDPLIHILRNCLEVTDKLKKKVNTLIDKCSSTYQKTKLEVENIVAIWKMQRR